MPRTEQSAAWTTPESRPNVSHVNFEAVQAADLADDYGPRCAALIPDTLELQHAPAGAPHACLTTTFAAPRAA